MGRSGIGRSGPMPTRTVRTVAEVMRTSVVTAQPSDTVAAASGRMVDEGVSAVIVVDGKRPIGILTERDLVRFNATGAAPDDTKVRDRKSDVEGKNVSVRVDIGGCRIYKKKT